MVEEIQDDYGSAYGFHSVCLRYFNATEADLEGELGERHEPESHLIPRVLQVATGQRDHIAVYGDDYQTPDGTCIRDYIHVWDLCSAHLLALEHLLVDGDSDVFNLGNGNSVQKVIDTARRVACETILEIVQERRAGDLAVLVADSQNARQILGWQPRFEGLMTIIAHAWKWEQRKGENW